MYDLIIIGGGPSALAAAFYAAGKRLHFVMVYEELGGKVGWLQSLAGPDPHQYLPGNELVHLLTTKTAVQADQSINDRVLKISKEGNQFVVETANHGMLHSITVLVATGASPIPLNVPGAERSVDRGLGYSVMTYAHLLQRKRIAVVGATTRALSGAAELAHTATRVFLIAPDSANLDTPLGRALRQHHNVEILEQANVLAVNGDDQVEEVVVEQSGQQRTLAVDHVFVALGVVPNSTFVRDLVATNAAGFIFINSYHETSVPGLFAAGDVSTLFSEQVIVAIGDGARAAMSAYEYVLARWLVSDQSEKIQPAA